MKPLRAVVVLFVFSALMGVAAAAVSYFSLTSPSNQQVGVVKCCTDYESMNMRCDVRYRVTATGTELNVNEVFIPASGAIRNLTKDTQISGSVPSALNTARTNEKTELDSAMSTAAAAGLFNQ